MNPRDKLKLEIMRALEDAHLSLCQLAQYVGNLETRATQIARALEELVDDGYLVVTEVSSTVGRVYMHASEHSLSDLDAKFLPHRDPVREAHAYEQAQERQPRYRRLPLEGADLDNDD